MPLQKYNFKDDHGHPLEKCREYRELLERCAGLERENYTLRARADINRTVIMQMDKTMEALESERDNSKPDNDNGIVVWDLDKMMWESIKKAASESSWIPEEYYMNDWVYDVCGWLRTHPEDAKTDTAEGERDALQAKLAAEDTLRWYLKDDQQAEDCYILHSANDRPAAKYFAGNGPVAKVE